jgi:hypothetical protein
VTPTFVAQSSRTAPVMPLHGAAIADSEFNANISANRFVFVANPARI